MEPQPDEIDLLLAKPRKNEPLLDGGISSDATKEVPKPTKDRSHERKDRSKDRSDLSVQRWGVIVPTGKPGDALLSVMKPLIDFRAEEQGDDPIVFRVQPKMDRKATLDWLYNVYENEVVDDPMRPFYLCLLGSPEQASLEFQHSVAHSAYIGRVHFDKPDGDPDMDAYAAYANKVVRYAREGRIEEPPELLYYVAPDGTKATRNAMPKLVSPSLEASQRAVDKNRLSAIVREVEADSVDDFLAAHKTLTTDGRARPSVLLSVSHGLGGSVDDYGSYEAQCMQQGALLLGHKEVLDAEAMSGKTFLPGGLWFMFACFGAGTPPKSEYHRWLTQLAKVGAYRDSANAVLSSLSQSETGFIAALPQVALRNPEGPLAVIGHIDLAWNFSYVNPSNPAESRSLKFTRALHRMAQGARVGPAHDEITEEFRVANFELTTIYESAEDAIARQRPDPTDIKRRGQVWMLRNDLRGYVLLGDPAVRLPQAEPAIRPPRPEKPAVAEVQTKATGKKDISFSRETIKAAVQALHEGNETPKSIAERAGCSLTQLFDWFVEDQKQRGKK